MSRPSSRLLATAASRISCPSSHSHTRTSLLRTATTTTITGSIPRRAFSQTCARDSLLSFLGSGKSQQQQQGQGQGQDQTQQQQQQPPRGPPRAPRPTNDGMADVARFLTDKVMYRGAQAGAAGEEARYPEQPLYDEVLTGGSYSPQYVAESGIAAAAGSAVADLGPLSEPFHFHIYAHKHNTHVTVTKPNRGAILSMSAGNIGFKKSKRGSYDAAYQLTAYALDKLNQGGWHKIICRMEVILRGFGPGREAATKVLLGAEGKQLRHTIVKVSDATKLKFGGTRSHNPRRV